MHIVRCSIACKVLAPQALIIGVEWAFGDHDGPVGLAQNRDVELLANLTKIRPDHAKRE